jgi:hypothetical protein
MDSVESAGAAASARSLSELFRQLQLKGLRMSDKNKVIDFSERAKTKLEEKIILQYAVEDTLAAQSMLVDAIDRMRELVDDPTVVRLLRNAIEILDGSA